MHSLLLKQVKVQNTAIAPSFGHHNLQGYIVEGGNFMGGCLDMEWIADSKVEWGVAEPLAHTELAQKYPGTSFSESNILMMRESIPCMNIVNIVFEKGVISHLNI